MGGEGGGVFLEGLGVGGFLRGGGVFGETWRGGSGGGRGGNVDGETAGVLEDAFQQGSGDGPGVIVLAVEDESFEFRGCGAREGGECDEEGEAAEEQGRFGEHRGSAVQGAVTVMRKGV